MARHREKSSKRPWRNEQQERAGERRFTRGNGIGDRRVEAPGEDALLAALAQHKVGATAGQLAEAMRGEPRTISTALRRLVQRGLILEDRPGRYRVSGAGGEFSAQVVADGDGLFARTPDGVLKPLHPRYRLGARPGDIIQLVDGEDGAAVTRILRRSGREVVGTMYFGPGEPQLICDNRRDGKLAVHRLFPEFDRQYKAGDRVVGTLEIDDQGEASVSITRILGKASPEVADLNYVKLTHDLPGDFPPEVEAEAQGHTKRFVKGKRVDLREELVFTIDPVTAKDFDDAISLTTDARGRRVLGVHIADVSHFVREGGVVDAEAVNRGTSIYLINRVIPMLPEALSNGLCSLVPNQPRYCLSAFLTLDAKCRLVDVQLAETIIESRHRLSYEEALEVLEKRDAKGRWPDDLRKALVEVSSIAQTLRKAREAAGAINLFSVEHRFKLDVDGVPIATEQEGSDISHQLIEECMLLANRAVARWLTDHGLPCSFRLHEAPDEEKLQQFALVLESYGKDSSGLANRSRLKQILADLANEPPAARLVLNLMLLRCFKKAVYGVDNVGHYALAFDHYCHFTSPIRRYPDLIAHRLVKCGLKLAAYKDTEVRREYLDALCKQASGLEQRAEVAERDLHARKSCRYLATRLGEEFAGVVSHPNAGGFAVQMLETGMEGFVPVRELSDDFYTYDPERLALVGRHSGKVISIGVEVDVIINHVDIDRGDVTLGLVQGRKTGAPAPAKPAAKPVVQQPPAIVEEPEEVEDDEQEPEALKPVARPSGRRPATPPAKPAAPDPKKPDTRRLPKKLFARWDQEDGKAAAAPRGTGRAKPKAGGKNPPKKAGKRRR